MLHTDKNSPSEIYHALIANDVELAHKLTVSSSPADLSSHSFRAMDLRSFSLDGISVNFSNCYFKNTDLRGLDLSKCNLDGASFHNARISGVLFPNNIDRL